MIRGILLWFASLLFFAFLATGLAIFSLENLTQEENIKPFFADQIRFSTEGNIHEEHLGACENADAIELSISGGEVTIGCDEVRSVQSDQYIDYLVDQHLFNEFYNKNYQCTFLECVFEEETSSIAFSSEGNKFYKNSSTFFFIGTIILAGLFAALHSTIREALIRFGSIFFFLGLGYFFSGPLSKVIFPQAEQMQATFNAISNPLNPFYLAFLIIGAILWGAGIYWIYKERKK